MRAGGLKHVIEPRQASEPVILEDPSFSHSLLENKTTLPWFLVNNARLGHDFK